MFENLKNAIREYESESVRKFAEALGKMTVANVLGSWSMREYLTPKAFEALKALDGTEMLPAAVAEKMTAKKARKAAKFTAERLAKLAEVEAVEAPAAVSVSVEWVYSRVWGYNPHATVTADKCRTYGRASGCGYDKESAAIASAFNSNPEIMRILYEYAERGEAFPYSVHTFAGLPSFDGGCGVSCFNRVFSACGYEWRQTGSGKRFNCYLLTRKER